MDNIFEIQKLDGQILQLKKQIQDSPANKRVKELVDFMHEGRSFIAKTNKYASSLITELNDVQAKYDNALSKTDIMRAQKADAIADEQLTNMVNTASSFLVELSRLEGRIKALNDNINHLIQDYNNAMNKLRVAKEKINVSKQEAQQVEAKIQPQIDELEKKKASLEAGCNPEMARIYKQMRADNIYPVFVHIHDKRCGGCHMELSLSFAEKLKNKKMLQCEECHRYILAD